jgi:hypothetical protein
MPHSQWEKLSEHGKAITSLIKLPEGVEPPQLATHEFEGKKVPARL